MSKIFLIMILFISLAGNIANATEIDEDALFSDIETIDNSIVNAAPKKELNISGAIEKISKSFTGNISTITDLSVKREFANNSLFYDDRNMHSIIKADLLFDIRLDNDIKTILNAEIFYSPQNDSYLQSQTISGQSLDKYYNHYVINEFFVDANINRKIYFRFGKQFLQWGRCYFWNPTDLINKERRSFSDLNKTREGIYGLKTHIPFGAKKNIYAFIDMSNEDNTDNIAVALKYEFLIKDIEFAFSVWDKEKYNTAYGFDFSARLFGLNTVGELSYTKGESKKKFDNSNFQIYKNSDKNNFRAAFGVNKFFDYEIKDRILANLEVYYNENGYKNNVFRPEFWQYSNLYEMNNHAKYYIAFFGSFDRFLVQNLKFNFNTIANLNDNSFIAGPGLNYNPYYNFSVDFNMFANFGKENREYTLSGNALTFNLKTNLIF